jgi:hypothetical protein
MYNDYRLYPNKTNYYRIPKKSGLGNKKIFLYNSHWLVGNSGVQWRLTNFVCACTVPTTLTKKNVYPYVAMALFSTFLCTLQVKTKVRCKYKLQYTTRLEDFFPSLISQGVKEYLGQWKQKYYSLFASFSAWSLSCTVLFSQFIRRLNGTVSQACRGLLSLFLGLKQGGFFRFGCVLNSSVRAS